VSKWSWRAIEAEAQAQGGSRNKEQPQEKQMKRQFQGSMRRRQPGGVDRRRGPLRFVKTPTRTMKGCRRRSSCTSPSFERAAIQRGSAGPVAWPSHCEADGVGCAVGAGGVGGLEKDGCDKMMRMLRMGHWGMIWLPMRMQGSTGLDCSATSQSIPPSLAR
jgi:hypothetical protein